MRTFLLNSLTATIFALFISQATFAQDQAKSVFKFTDGYFQSSGEPAHLVHDGIKLSVGLGDEYSLWLDFKVNPGVVNPCSRREENPCVLVQWIAIRHKDGQEEFVAGWKKGLEFRADDTVGFSTSQVSIPRTSPTGEAILIVRVVKNHELVFNKEWPVDVR